MSYRWMPLVSRQTAMSLNRTYHVKVEISGYTFKMYVDDMNTPVITCTDTMPYPFIHGKVGLRSLGTHTHFDNIRVYADAVPVDRNGRQIFGADIRRFKGNSAESIEAFSINGRKLSTPGAGLSCRYKGIVLLRTLNRGDMGTCEKKIWLID
jgi:hypothetical protein